MMAMATIALSAVSIYLFFKHEFWKNWHEKEDICVSQQ